MPSINPAKITVNNTIPIGSILLIAQEPKINIPAAIATTPTIINNGLAALRIPLEFDEAALVIPQINPAKIMANATKFDVLI